MTSPRLQVAPSSSSQHDQAVDKTRSSLARIEAMIAKTTAASRKYMPYWEKKKRRGSAPANKTKKQEPSSSTHRRRRASTSTPKSPEVETPTTSPKPLQKKSTWQIHSKTEWSPLPASPKLSAKSHTQPNEKIQVKSPLSSITDTSSSKNNDEFIIVVQMAPHVPSKNNQEEERLVAPNKDVTKLRILIFLNGF